MSVRSQEPGECGRGPVQNWKYLDVPCGGSAVGFMGGRYVGVWCHTVHKRSKPCRLRMSEGALSCPHCSRLELVWRGYVPIYDREYVWRFVVINADYRESVGEIERFTQVKMFRGKQATAPIVIRAENWRTLAIPRSTDRTAEPELVPALLRMWKDDELSAWHYATAGAAPIGPVSPPDPPSPPDAPAALVNRVEAARRNREKLREGIEPLADMLQKGGRESGLYHAGNGKPKPK